MAIFGPKPWVNPYGKMSIFRLFKLLVFTVYANLASWVVTLGSIATGKVRR